MATTTLFVEIIIIGLETLACLLGLTGLVTGFSMPSLATAEQWNTEIKEWATLVTLLVVAAAYVLGILVDRIADDIHTGLRKGARKVLALVGIEAGRLPAAPGLMRLTVLKESEGIAKFLDYQRSRLRIARATVLNLVVGLPIVVEYLARAGHGRRIPLAVSVCVIVAVIYATKGINQAYEKRLAEAYTLLQQQDAS